MITNFGALLEAAKQFSGKKVLVVFPLTHSSIIPGLRREA